MSSKTKKIIIAIILVILLICIATTAGILLINNYNNNNEGSQNETGESNDAPDETTCDKGFELNDEGVCVPTIVDEDTADEDKTNNSDSSSNNSSSNNSNSSSSNSSNSSNSSSNGNSSSNSGNSSSSNSGSGSGNSSNSSSSEITFEQMKKNLQKYCRATAYVGWYGPVEVEAGGSAPSACKEQVKILNDKFKMDYTTFITTYDSETLEKNEW